MVSFCTLLSSLFFVVFFLNFSLIAYWITKNFYFPLFQLTPVYLDVGADLDWLCYLEQYQSLSSSERRVADLIGIEERFITRCAAGAPSSAASCHGNTNVVNRRLNLHRRFYTALVLYRLVNEDGLQIVAKKFGVNRGLLQSLQQQSATYAGGFSPQVVTCITITVGLQRIQLVQKEFLLRNLGLKLLISGNGAP